MNLDERTREAVAWAAAVTRYERMADLHRAREANLLLLGFDYPAAKHGLADRLLLRAWIAEKDNPAPKEPAA